MNEDKKIILRGVPASPGIAFGKVAILKSPTDESKMEEGDILVTQETTPEYTIAILKASAIVTDRGGILSHPAIVAREMGIPGVVGTGNATQKLKDGMLVKVDGKEGIIYE
ncbi:MAG: hypothetical protein GF353_11210 [Candidatus Lokiarchaeota archaeon]|nr:hypothetical protein [Candidatus Lokiarchaeota archaeon]